MKISSRRPLSWLSVAFLPLACSLVTAFLVKRRPETGGAVVRHRLFARRSSSKQPQGGDSGEVSGPNWIERSFPVDTGEKVDPKRVDDYDLGINGVSLGTGPLSGRMYEAIVSRSSFDVTDPEIQRSLKLYAMDFTAKEAVRAALKQNGLELVLADDEQDEGLWGDIDSIRLLNYEDDEGQQQPIGVEIYDSWEEAIDEGWTPGQGFSFVARQVPAKMAELSLDELLTALDPDGSLREEAKDKGMVLPGKNEEITTLRGMANYNARRTELAPRETASADEEAFAGTDAAGYRVINAKELSVVQDDTATPERTVLHVMDALVSHGCLIVDVTNGGTTFEDAAKFSAMWKTAARCFDKVREDGGENIFPVLKTAQDTGSQHAKVGFASYDNGNLQFLETRTSRATGQLLPVETESVLGPQGCQSLQDAFDVVANVGKDVVRIVVAASTEEAGTSLFQISSSAFWD